MNNPKAESLKKRYFFKLGGGLIGIPMAMVIAGIVPRVLGPAAYGNFTFLTEFFNKIIAFFDSGTSIGFYTKLSQRLSEISIIKFYWFFVLSVSLIISIFVPVVFLLNKQNLLWPDQSVQFVWMALVFSLLNWSSSVVIQIVDAYGYTAKGEIVRFVRKILGFLLILGLFFFKSLNLTTFFIYHYFGVLIIIIGCRYLLKKCNIPLFPGIKLTLVQVKKYIKEFWIYSYPLLTSSFVALFVGLLDVWMLQKFAGPVQQGFYGLAFQISGICFLFASSMTPLIMREFSIAFGNKDTDKMRFLFSHYIPMIYALIAFLVVFISYNSGFIVLLFGGKKFVEAKLAIALMVLYPLHQGYGQLSGSFFYATAQTKLLRNIGVTFMIIGLPVAYFLLAPISIFGLDLGATGLAIKMIAMQFVVVNVLLYYNAKYLKISFLKIFGHQMYIIVMFGLIAYISCFLSGLIMEESIFSFLLNGVIYTSLSIGMLFSFPIIFSLSRGELNRYVDMMISSNPLKRKKTDQI
ncbi:MAG: lipopolysaccharide biosynthesis protein [Bacteroidales bacterium]|nr:lipopolysaccharide biosynthesis protein [Bacteroidales bacterium]